MLMCRHTQFKSLDIWSPRWHDRRVLLAVFKVGEHNKVRFPKTKSLPDTYYISGKTARKYPKETNGTIDCFSVPLDEFQPLELREKCEHDYV